MNTPTNSTQHSGFSTDILLWTTAPQHEAETAHDLRSGSSTGRLSQTLGTEVEGEAAQRSDGSTRDHSQPLASEVKATESASSLKPVLLCFLNQTKNSRFTLDSFGSHLNAESSWDTPLKMTKLWELILASVKEISFTKDVIQQLSANPTIPAIDSVQLCTESRIINVFNRAQDPDVTDGIDLRGIDWDLVQGAGTSTWDPEKRITRVATTPIPLATTGSTLRIKESSQRAAARRAQLPSQEDDQEDAEGEPDSELECDAQGNEPTSM